MHGLFRIRIRINTTRPCPPCYKQGQQQNKKGKHEFLRDTYYTTLRLARSKQQVDAWGDSRTNFNIASAVDELITNETKQYGQLA